MLRVLIYCLCIMLLLSVQLGRAATEDLYPFAEASKQRQFNQLTQNLRCLVCQNENLADSTANLASDLREQIYHKVQAGESDQQIIHYLVKRYGQFVLYQPPVMKTTYILWFGPFILLLLGFIILFIAVRKRRNMVESVR